MAADAVQAIPAVTTLADSAHSVVEIEGEAPLAARAVARIGPSFGTEGGYFLHPQPRSTPVRFHILRDVVFDGDTMIVGRDGALVADTVNLVEPDELVTLDLRAAGAVSLGVSGTVVVALNRGSHNYFHWLIQVLPEIDVACRAAADVSLLTGPALPWQTESLTLLGHAGTPRIEVGRDRRYRIASLGCSGFVYGAKSFRMTTTAPDMYRRMAERVPRTPGPRRIYVSRADAGHRRVINEDLLRRELERRGFTVVTLGGRLVAEQINMFRNADIVVGPHGAGLSNIVFCEPGAVLYEFVPEGYLNSCFNVPARAAGVHYFGDLCAAEGDGPPWLRNITVDMPTVQRRLDEAEVLASLRGEAGDRTIGDFNAWLAGRLSALETPLQENPQARGSAAFADWVGGYVEGYRQVAMYVAAGTWPGDWGSKAA
jgi:hypothetical protein